MTGKLNTRGLGGQSRFRAPPQGLTAQLMPEAYDPTDVPMRRRLAAWLFGRNASTSESARLLRVTEHTLLKDYRAMGLDPSTPPGMRPSRAQTRWRMPGAVDDRRAVIAWVLARGPALNEEVALWIGASLPTVRRDIEFIRGHQQDFPRIVTAADVEEEQQRLRRERRERVLFWHCYGGWSLRQIAVTERVTAPTIENDLRVLEQELGAEGLALVARAAEEGRLPPDAEAMYVSRREAQKRGSDAARGLGQSPWSAQDVWMSASAADSPAAIASSLGLNVGTVELILGGPGIDQFQFIAEQFEAGAGTAAIAARLGIEEDEVVAIRDLPLLFEGLAANREKKEPY